MYPNGMKAHLQYYGDEDDQRLQSLSFVRGNNSAISSFAYGYDTDGTITSWQRNRDGMSSDTWHFGYDAVGQLTEAVLKDPSETVLKTMRYGYDGAGNLLGRGDGTGGMQMGKANSLNQLVETADGPTRFYGLLDKPAQVSVDGEPARLRTIDHQGAAVHSFEAWLELSAGTHEIEIIATDGNENTSTQSYEVAVAGGNGEVLEYDLNGNLIKRTAGSAITTYDWDAENRLIAIHYPDGGSTAFVYDGYWRRVAIIEKDDTETITDYRRFIWDGLTIIEERDGITNAVRKRFFDYGFEIATGTEAGDYFTTFDHLGSIREIVDDTETLVSRYDYDPYGNVEQLSGTVQSDFLFTGHFYHERSSLSLAPFRAYDVGLGRWLSRDPIEFVTSEMPEILPEGPNLYAYVANVPTVYTDEYGLWVWWAPAAIGAVLGGVSATIASYISAQCTGGGFKHYARGIAGGIVGGAISGYALLPGVGITGGAGIGAVGGGAGAWIGGGNVTAGAALGAAGGALPTGVLAPVAAGVASGFADAYDC